MMQNQEVNVVDSSSSDEEEFEAAADAATTTAATATTANEAAANEEVEVPDHLAFFRCPFTYALMRNPMMCADGNSYEEANIQRWLSNNNKSPLTNLRLEHKTLTPNHNL
jgi:hypothetical protein